jgi:excisionase family DNA binding protein
MPAFAVPLPGIIADALAEGRLLSAAEVAAALSLSKGHVYELDYRGRLRGLRVGRALRFHPETVARFIGAHSE